MKSKKQNTYFYAIHKGFQPGVYSSWAEAKRQITGYPKAKFKKFASRREALHFAEYGEILELPMPKYRKIDPNAIHIFTDGSFSSKTKRSGYAVVFPEKYKNHTKAARLEDGATNQLAELVALQEAIEEIERIPTIIDQPVIIWTDSDYSLKCVTTWYHGWEKNGWKTTKGTKVKYALLIQDIHRMINNRRYNLQIRHIKDVGIYSHDARPADPFARIVWRGNKKADELANLAHK